MTLPRMAAISKRWREVPPLAVSVAQLVSAFTAPAKKEPEDVQGLFDMAARGNGISEELPEWLKATNG